MAWGEIRDYNAVVFVVVFVGKLRGLGRGSCGQADCFCCFVFGQS